MGNKFKYMRRVFSGKRVPVIGLDQGKGKLYRGNGVSSLFNLIYDTSMQPRFGQTRVELFDNGINTGVSGSRYRVIGEGSNLRAESNAQ